MSVVAQTPPIGATVIAVFCDHKRETGDDTSPDHITLKATNISVTVEIVEDRKNGAVLGHAEGKHGGILVFVLEGEGEIKGVCEMLEERTRILLLRT